MKRLFWAATACALVSLHANAQTNYDKLNKELEIMTNIIKTSLKTSNKSDSSIKLRSVDALYLANQGVVFELNTSFNGASFLHMSGIEMPQIEGFSSEFIWPDNDGFHIEIDDESIGKIVEDALEVAKWSVESSHPDL